MELITSKDLEQIASRRPGLLVGPGATLAVPFMSELAKALGVDPSPSPFPFRDDQIKTATPADVVRAQVAASSPAMGLADLGQVFWSSVLSATPDRYLEDALTEGYTKIANRPPVDVVGDDLSRPPTSPSLTVYKLLGEVASGNYTLGEASFQRRKARWSAAIRTFRDDNKGGASVCMGFHECPRVLFDLLSALMQAQALPQYLVFLESDPIAGNDTLDEMLSGMTRACVVSATSGELVRTVQRTRVVRVATTTTAEKDDWPNIALHNFAHIAAVVNQWVGSRPDARERNRLADLLFSPKSSNWDPFVAELDLRRDVEQQVVVDLKDQVERKTAESVSAVLLGGSSTGKTTLMKRVALELATDGELCLWLKPNLNSNGDLLMRDLFAKIAKQMPALKRPVLVFLDDPGNFSPGTARQIAIAAERADLSVVLVQAIRTSEWDPSSTSEALGTLPIMSQWELPDELSAAEMARLPAVLKNLDIVATESDAQVQLHAAESKHAQDCLAVLFTLIPQSRSVIARSLKEEHLRLGQPKTLPRVLTALAADSSAPLQRAYEFVAVATKYGVPAPVEVLVSALGIDYGTWIAETSPGTAAWGILYPTVLDEDADGAYYAARNGIVADTIIESLNAGALGRSGEMRVLREMMSACTGSQLFYREFCVRTLTSRAFKKRFEFEEGLQLFDTAIAALPFPDKTLLHQKGLWIKNKGHDPVTAREVLNEALATPNYPNARRVESDVHIYTTLAANAVDAVEAEKTTPSEGKREILSCLTRAQATGKFDPTAIHVQANAIAKLTKRSTMDADMLQLVNAALRAVADTLFTLNADRRNSPVRADDTRMLESVEVRLLARASDKLDDLGELAETLWNQHHSQEGFVFEGTRHFSGATKTGNRGDLSSSYEYVEQKIRTIEEAGEVPVRALVRLAIQIIFDWRVSRAARGNADLKEVWPKIEALGRRYLSGADPKDDPAIRYIYALALAHQKKWHDSRVAFQQLRESGLPRVFLWAPRHLLLANNGHPLRVQGTIRKGAQGSYLASRQVDNDFPLSMRQRGDWPPVNNEAFAHVEFAYGGPSAVHPQD